MEKNVRFYRCPICGNIIGLIEGSAEHIMCCGRPMELMEANVTDAAIEKHVPSWKKLRWQWTIKRDYWA